MSSKDICVDLTNWVDIEIPGNVEPYNITYGMMLGMSIMKEAPEYGQLLLSRMLGAPSSQYAESLRPGCGPDGVARNLIKEHPLTEVHND